MFIQTESTPNPHSTKFLPGQEVLPSEFGTGMYFQKDNTRELQKSPLAKRLMQLDGVTGVFLGRDFVTITKDADASWQSLKPQVFAKIMDFFQDGLQAVTSVPEASDTFITDEDDEVVAMIKELIETRIRPAVQEDGGDIFYHGFDLDTGLVKVKLAGSCVGCPSSSATLKNGVENMLKHYIPEVKGVENVTDEVDAVNEAEAAELERQLAEKAKAQQTQS